MKILLAIFTSLFVFSIALAVEITLPGPFLYGNKISKEIADWKIVDKGNKSLTYTYEITNPAQNPRLHIDCVYRDKGKKRYRMYLENSSNFNTEDPEFAEMVIRVDDGDRARKRLSVWDNRMIVSDFENTVDSMLRGDKIAIRFRDKKGPHDYVFNLAGLEEVLLHMKNVCGFSYKFKDTKDIDLRPKLEAFVNDVNKGLPVLFDAYDGMVFVKLNVNPRNIIDHIVVIRDKINEEISFEEMNKIIDTSKNIGKEFCTTVEQKDNKYHKLFSENNIGNMLFILDKTGQQVVHTSSFVCFEYQQI